MLNVTRLCLCLCIVGVTLYAYLSKLNELTRLRIEVPKLTKKLRHIQEENSSLQYEKERFENPANLMKLLRKPQWSHLKHPPITDIIEIEVPKTP